MMMGCPMGGMWFFGLTGFVIAIALVGLGAWVAMRLLKRPTSDARRTLEERFARGDIDAREFEDRRHLLEGRR